MRWYSRQLENRPYRAHMATAGVLWFAGDVVSQKFQQSTAAKEEEDQPSKSATSADVYGSSQWNWKRTGIMTAFGIFGAGKCVICISLMNW